VETDASQVSVLLAELGYPSTALQVTERFQRLAREGASIFVSEIDGRVAGLAVMDVGSLVEDDDLYCGLIALVVGSQWRRRGAGRMLVQAVETEAARRRCGSIVLNSGDHRRDAHAFYKRLGYASTGRRFIKRL
jgi:GNAT superfamily N-acetyltransferase